MNTAHHKGRRTDIVFFALLAAVLVFALWLAPYGWAGSDEAYYIAEPYRFVQGDVYFVDDWNCGQLFSFVLLPLMRLYLLLFPSTDGIFLFFRQMFAVAGCLVSLAVYLRGRRLSPTGALFAGLMLALYAPLSVRSFSYNAMGLWALILACMLAITAERHPFLDHVLAGLLLAALVLCCPFAVALVVLYVLAVAVFALVRRDPPFYTLTPRALLAVLLGAGGLFLVFCAFVLSRASLGELITAFPYVFRDPEHRIEPILWLAKNVLYCALTSAPYSRYILALCAVLAFAVLLDRGRMRRRAAYLIAAAVLAGLYCAPFTLHNITNELMLPLSILGFFAFLLSEKKQSGLFWLLFVPGLVYAVCMHHSSSLRYYALCHGFAVCSTASAFFLCRAVQELWEDRRETGILPRRAACLLLALALVSQLGLETLSRMQNFFHDEGFAALDTTLEAGAQKRLITSREHAAEYAALLRDTETLRQAGGDYVLYVSDAVWPPLSDPKRSANNSLWTNYDKPGPSAELLREYLLLHPEKRPVAIYVTRTLRYTYQADIDGMVIVDLLNLEDLPVEITETGYILRLGGETGGR